MNDQYDEYMELEAPPNQRLSEGMALVSFQVVGVFIPRLLDYGAFLIWPMGAVFLFGVITHTSPPSLNEVPTLSDHSITQTN